MTLQGTVNKTGFLLLCVVATAAWTWGLSHSPEPGAGRSVMIGGVFGGLIVALVTIFKANWAPFTAPVYRAPRRPGARRHLRDVRAHLPGRRYSSHGSHLRHAFRDAARIQDRHDSGHAGLQAWRNRRHRRNCASLSRGNGSWRFFHIQVPAINGSGAVGIGFSLFVVVIAALNLVLDFDMIETGVQGGAPKYMEWYGRLRPDGHTYLVVS